MMTNLRRARPQKPNVLRKRIGIIAKAKRDLRRTQLCMMQHRIRNTKVVIKKGNCNAHHSQGTFGSRPTKVHLSADRSVRQPNTLSSSSNSTAMIASKSNHSSSIASKHVKQTNTLGFKDPAVASKYVKETNTLDFKEKLISSEERKVHTFVQDSNNGVEGPRQPFKVLPGLAHKGNNVNRLSHQKSGSPLSSLKGLSVLNKDGSHERAKQDEVVTSRGKEQSQPSPILGTNLSNFERDTSMKDKSCAMLPSRNIGRRCFTEANPKLYKRKELENQDGKTSNSISKRTARTLIEEDNQCSKPAKKQRQHTRIIKDVEEKHDNIDLNHVGVDNGGCDQNHVGFENGATRSTPHATILKDCNTKVPLCVEQECYCCSKPIDKPTWRGIFKICGKNYVSLAGHLSTRSGVKVWELSGSLISVVEVTKISRSEVWPKGWEESKPNGNNIGLYFFSNEMRPDEDFDRLVMEVMDNDLVLRAIIGEVEMLIFPSILLPKRYQTFQMKHYLWGVFKPREGKGVTIAEALNEKQHCAYEVQKKAQHVSHQHDVAQYEECNHEMISNKTCMVLENHQLPAKSTQKIDGSSFQGATSVELKAPQQERRDDALHHEVGISEATMAASNGATLHPNQGRSDPSRGLLPTSMIFAVVSNATPKVQQLIQEMEREGAMVVAVKGESFGAGSLPGNIAATQVNLRP